MPTTTTNRRTTGSICPNCGAGEMGIYQQWTRQDPGGWKDFAVEHKPDYTTPTASPVNCYAWDKLAAAGQRPRAPRPFGPDRRGSSLCRSGSIASGGTREYCTCDTCF